MHLLVDISAHGFGHLAQTAPVLDALAGKMPGLRLTLRSALPRARLAECIGAEFVHAMAASDFGFAMHSAVDIDRPASARRYRELHADWPKRVAEEAAWQAGQGVDAVLTNIAYLPLAGAAAAGIPGIAMCSLNWADLVAHYFAGEPWVSAVHAQIEAAYVTARPFLRLTPGLPMAWHPAAEAMAPVARPGSPDRRGVAGELGLDERQRWVLLAMGGMEFPLDVGRWPQVDGITWLVPGGVTPTRADQRHVAASGARFSRLLASVDAVITKPGYGTFVEAACAGVPILWLSRADWPETPYLAGWLERHARARELSREQLAAGDFLDMLDALWTAAPPPPPVAGGAAQVASRLRQLLAPLQ